MQHTACQKNKNHCMVNITKNEMEINGINNGSMEYCLEFNFLKKEKGSQSSVFLNPYKHASL